MKFIAEMKVVRFGCEDVIATSGTLEKTITIGNAGDGEYRNSTFSFGNYSLTPDAYSVFILSAMRHYFELPTTPSSGDVKFYSGKSFTYFTIIYDGDPGTKFDGTYEYSGYIDGKYVFTKKQ